MIEAVVFDFDGVILESADIKTVAFRRLFEDDYPDLTGRIVAYHLEHEGISRYDKFRYIYAEMIGEPLSSEAERELGRRFSEIVLEEILQAPYVPGAVEFLEGHHAVMPLFVASGTPQEELHLIAEQRDVAKYFREMHGTPQTKADIINDILERYGLTPKEAVLVGDAHSDVRAARETGINFVGREIPGEEKQLDCEVRIVNLTGLAEALHVFDGDGQR